VEISYDPAVISEGLLWAELTTLPRLLD
jgi:hypothetical protein